MAVDGTSVYWTNAGAGTVMKAPLAGGAAHTLASDQGKPYGLAVDGAAVYWVTRDGGTVMKATLDGTNPGDHRLSGQDGAVGIVLDDRSVYWTTQSTVVSAPLAGGAPMTLAVGRSLPYGLAVQGTRVYFSEAERGTIVMVTAL